MRIFSALLLLSLACSSNNRRAMPRSDAGIDGDSGTPSGDSGTITRMDSSTLPRDSSVPPRDSGGGSCAEDLVPAFSGSACSTSTAACTALCPDGTCISDCLDADSNPDCAGCANQNIISCTNANGCQAPWNCFVQCFTDQGCDAPDAPTDCAAARCGAQRTAYNTCSDGVTTGDCGTTWTSCLP